VRLVSKTVGNRNGSVCGTMPKVAKARMVVIFETQNCQGFDQHNLSEALKNCKIVTISFLNYKY
jgi:hypothetical protein